MVAHGYCPPTPRPQVVTFHPPSDLTTVNQVYTDDDDDAWQERTSVRQEIQSLIEQRQGLKRPPFRFVELMVMAVLCSRKRSINLDQIIKWIISAFGYYREVVSTDWVKWNSSGKSKGEGYYKELVEECKKALDCWEAPFTWHSAPQLYYGIVSSTTAHGGDAITVPADAGRIFLRNWLGPEKGIFRFLDLPVELREIIYQMVFTFPASGIHPRSYDEPGHGLQLQHREVDDIEKLGGDRLETTSIQLKLALLSTNKQIYNEAKPYFYSCNNFHFVGGMDLLEFAEAVGFDRFQHVGGLRLSQSLRHAYRDNGQWYEVAAWLGTLKRPRIVKLSFPTEDYSAQSGYPQYYKPEEWLGMKELAAAGVRAKSFEVKTKYPMLKEYLLDLAEKLKAGAVEMEMPQDVEAIEESTPVATSKKQKREKKKADTRTVARPKLPASSNKPNRKRKTADAEIIEARRARMKGKRVTYAATRFELRVI